MSSGRAGPGWSCGAESASSTPGELVAPDGEVSPERVLEAEEPEPVGGADTAAPGAAPEEPAGAGGALAGEVVEGAGGPVGAASICA